MPADTTSVPFIAVDGTEVSQLDDLMELRIIAEIGMASRADLRLDVTRNPDLIAAYAPGKEVSVSVATPDVETIVFTGEIVSVGFDRRLDRDALTVQAWDKAHRLGRNVVHQVFTNQSRSDILNTLVSAAGLSFSCTGNVLSETMPYYQVASTPRRLLDDFCAREGCEWLNVNGTITVRQRTNNEVATFGSDELRSVELRASGIDQATEVTVNGWDPDRQQVVTASADRLGEHKNDPPMVNTTTDATKGRTATVEIPSTYRVQSDAQAAAEGLLRRFDSTVIRGRGEVEADTRLVPGCQIRLENLTTEWSGKYHVTSIEHLFGDRRAFITRFHFGPLPSPSPSEAEIDAGLGSTAVSGHRPLIAKVTETGFGTDVDEPMVKVKFPTLSEELQSDWLRVLSVGAGPDRGFVMPFDVDDEVLVAFPGPELSTGVVIGGLHSQASKPPDSLQVVDSRHGVIVLKSTSNTFTMVDDGVSDPKPGFHATTTKTTIDIDEEKVSVVTTDLPITIKNDKASIELAANGNITIEGEQVAIKGMKGVTISSQGGDVKADGLNVNLEAKTNLTGKGNAGATIESTGITAVKGSMVQLN